MPLYSNRTPSLETRDLDLGGLLGVSELVAHQFAGTRNAKHILTRAGRILCPRALAPARCWAQPPHCRATGTASKQGEALHERQEHIKRALLKRDLHYLADCNPAPDVDYSGADESWGQLWPSRGTPASELPAKNTSTCELQCCFLPHKGIAVYLFHWEHGHTPHIPSRKQHPMKFMAKVCFNATL